MSTPLGCIFGETRAFLDGVVEIDLSVGMFDPCRPCRYVPAIKAGMYTTIPKMAMRRGVVAIPLSTPDSLCP